MNRSTTMFVFNLQFVYFKLIQSHFDGNESVYTEVRAHDALLDNLHQVRA